MPPTNAGTVADRLLNSTLEIVVALSTELPWGDDNATTDRLIDQDRNDTASDTTNGVVATAIDTGSEVTAIDAESQVPLTPPWWSLTIIVLCVVLLLIGLISSFLRRWRQKSIPPQRVTPTPPASPSLRLSARKSPSLKLSRIKLISQTVAEGRPTGHLTGGVMKRIASIKNPSTGVYSASGRPVPIISAEEMKKQDDLTRTLEKLLNKSSSDRGRRSNVAPPVVKKEKPPKRKGKFTKLTKITRPIPHILAGKLSGSSLTGTLTGTGTGTGTFGSSGHSGQSGSYSSLSSENSSGKLAVSTTLKQSALPPPKTSSLAKTSASGKDKK